MESKVVAVAEGSFKHITVFISVINSVFFRKRKNTTGEVALLQSFSQYFRTL